MRKFLPILALVVVTCWSAGEVKALNIYRVGDTISARAYVDFMKEWT